ncbi:hypothetical protein K493DRAFT_5587 [Basidiobolus meristosporus CBS 931.73]|uniref:PH domain-containing protein n=1 Tax=Basidiobolus meristosporus CBS 931.73 TaxID=1314790 RepID=A0A1Y1YKS0_9FUNG|nr:hypothetical protein K493DRAFT_5587 [Basidiobolus meristosporus CBS 931.73]|eukprot:ORX98627.1 hypothetical protein K493DRAFT_5587 [Basidiobolus meristosporus CBS 931.73]
MSLILNSEYSSPQSDTVLSQHSSTLFDIKALILNDGKVKRGEEEYYLVLYERFATMAEVKQAFEAGSRTMFICSSVMDLRDPVILNCSSISRISPENSNEGEKYSFRVEVDGRVFQFHTNTKDELVSWIKAFKTPLPKVQKIQAQATEEEEEYLSSEVEFDCTSVHSPTDLAAFYRFGSPPSIKKWKKGLAKPFKLMFKAVKKGIEHNSVIHIKRPKHKLLPKTGAEQNKHVFPP